MREHVQRVARIVKKNLGKQKLSLMTRPNFLVDVPLANFFTPAGSVSICWLQRKTVVSFYCFFFSPFCICTELKMRTFHLVAIEKYTHTVLEILDIIPCIASVVGSWKKNTHFKKFKRKLEAAAAQCLEWTNFVFDVCGLICLFTFSYFLSFWRVVLFFFYLFHLTPSAIEDLIIFDVVLHYYGTASPYFLLACILLGCRPVPDRQRCKEPTRPTGVNREPTKKTD